MFIAFNAKVKHLDELLDKWITFSIDKELTDRKIYHIDQFPKYYIEINFNCPEESQNRLIELTEQVENECPVAKTFGQLGVGEGIVWKPIESRFNSSKFWFKVKGEKHSVSKVKTLAAVDIEVVNNIKEFVEKVITENRLNQGLSYLTEQSLETDIKNIGTFLKWVVTDVFKEEMDTLTASGLTNKEVGSAMSNAAKKWFMSKI